MSADFIRLANKGGMSIDELAGSLGRMAPGRKAHIDAQAIAARKAATRDNFSPGLKIATMSPEELSESAVRGSTPYQRFMLNAEKRNVIADERALQAGLFQMEIKTNPEMQAVQRNLAQKEMAVQLGGRNQSNVPLQQLQEKLRRSNVANGGSVTVTPRSSQGSATQVASSPASKSTTSSPANKAAAGSEVGSKQAADITGYAGSMMGGLAAVGVGAGVGGVTSYATGGEFGKGAVAGGMVAGGAYLGMSTMATNSKAINAAVAKGGEGFGAGVMGAMQGANQVIGGASVAGRRAALMGGAGLAGLTFGGNRRSHRRGFNQSRGSRI